MDRRRMRLLRCLEMAGRCDWRRRLAEFDRLREDGQDGEFASELRSALRGRVR
ncbi:MAG: hypothetical protein V1875_09920 [Candidatus Altiarchaeota archaeon]